MPRYFFDVKNGHRLVDPAGMDCLNDEAAKSAGRMIAAQIAADGPSRHRHPRRVAVIDDSGHEVAAIEIDRVVS